MAGTKEGVGGIYNRNNSNLYHYSNNNPITYTDPDGRMAGSTQVYFGANFAKDIVNGCKIINFLIKNNKMINRTNFKLDDLNNTDSVIFEFRKTDGNSNEFDTERYTLSLNGGIYHDTVGANCSEYNFKEGNGQTKPDGEYYLTTNSSNLTKQSDGTYNSPSYEDTMSFRTNDPNIPKEIRNDINGGAYLNHAAQKIGKLPYGIGPQSAGCSITLNTTEQKKFMNNLRSNGDVNNNKYFIVSEENK